LAPDAGHVGGGDQAKEALAKRRIWITDLVGSNQPKQITNDGNYRDEHPMRSSDGKSILFCRVDRKDRGMLWLIRADVRNLCKFPVRLSLMEAGLAFTVTSPGVADLTGTVLYAGVGRLSEAMVQGFRLRFRFPTLLIVTR